MFKKMQNRKGFTLIEMLVVIAIIAILVSILIPVVSGSNVKAAAAANASNLRGVEGEVVSLMLLEPAIFDKENAEQVATVGTMLDYMVANRNDVFDAYDQTVDNVAALENAVTEAEQRLQAAESALTDAENQQRLAESVVESAQLTVSGLQTTVSGLQTTYNSAKSAWDDVKDSWWIASWIKEPLEEAFLEAEENLSKAQTQLQKAQDTLADENTKKAIAEASLATANSLVTAAQETRAAAEENLAQARAALEAYGEDFKAGYDQQISDLSDELYKLMYIYEAVDGELDLNGATLEAPASKKVKTETVDVDNDVQMVVFVDLENYQAYAMYAGYRSYDFAAVAGETAGNAVTG